MSSRTEWMIYGANGYTGRLVAAEARRRGLKPMLAGRRAAPIEKLAAELGLPVRAFGLDDATAAAAAIADMAVVANCAGPFAATSAPMIDACLTSRANYLDITGEIDVFLAAHRRHADAQAAGIVICPGVGFDVIPTDCMAAVLQGGAAQRNPPRTRVRRARTHEPWHRAHDGAISAARPARRPGTPERGA